MRLTKSDNLHFGEPADRPTCRPPRQQTFAGTIRRIDGRLRHRGAGLRILELGDRKGAERMEPAHALAKVIELAPKRSRDHLMVMNLCGRGDKDIFSVAEYLGGM